MKRHRVWCLMLISGLGALFFTMAKPASERDLKVARWGHVNRTCRARDCDENVNYEQIRCIESYMNESANPCENFYDYACGNWHREHSYTSSMMMKGTDQLTSRLAKYFENWVLQHETPAEKDAIKLNSRRSLAEHNEPPEKNQLPEIQEIWRPSEDLVFQKMLTYYRVCKDQNAITQPSLRDYFDISKSSIKWQLNEYDWIAALAGMGRFGYSSHFLRICFKQKNVSSNRIIIGPHDSDSQLFQLNSEIYEILRDFTDQPQDALQLRFNELETNLEELNCQYCRHGGNDENEFDECNCYDISTMTYANLTSELSEVEWSRYLNLQFGRDLRNDEIIEVVDIKLIKLQLEYVSKIEKELNLLYTLARFLKYIEEQRDHLNKYDTVALNCIHHMRNIFNLPLNYIYERAYYSTKRVQSQAIIEEVFEELKIQFESIILRNNMQFTSSIQQKLISKLKHININIGNLPKNVSLQFYYDYIFAYNFGNNFARNHMHALEVFYKKYNSLMDASEPELQYIWHSFVLHHPIYPDTMDASPYYYPHTNLIVITYSYLHLPFFDASFWPVFIYGDLASTLGHEIIHAFDTQFLNFDGYGNDDAEPLTSMFLNQNFKNNYLCLQRGTLYERERIADVSGARLALNTFLSLDRNALERNGELYFLQFSQFFCGYKHREDLSHDINSMRLNYVVRALPEFSSVFKCALGSPMNPRQKCEMYI